MQEQQLPWRGVGTIVSHPMVIFINERYVSSCCSFILGAWFRLLYDILMFVWMIVAIQMIKTNGKKYDFSTNTHKKAWLNLLISLQSLNTTQFEQIHPHTGGWSQWAASIATTGNYGTKTTDWKNEATIRTIDQPKPTC